MLHLCKEISFGNVFLRADDGKRQEVLKKALHLFGKGEEGVEEGVLKVFKRIINFDM